MAFDGFLRQSTGDRWRERAWEALVNGYFSMHNRILFDAFWTELVSAQDALLSLGAPFSDPSGLRSVIRNLQVAVFMNVGRSRVGFFRMSDAEAEAMFCKVRWPETEGMPVCPHCGGLNAYECRRSNGSLRFRCKACQEDFTVNSLR
jgi:Transposase zinc-ribbon domain